jgi:hypothetical protein
MYPVSLPTLVTRVAQCGNWESTAVGGLPFMNNVELADKINQSIAKWYDMVRLTTWGGQYYRKTVKFNTVGAQEFYDFQSVGMTDFLDMISVDVFAGGPGATKITCKPYPEEQRNIFQFFPVGLLLTWPSFYQLQGNGLATPTQSGGPGINFIPAPPGAYQIGCNYTPVAPILSGTQTIDSINGWDEWIVLDAAVKCAIKDRQFDLAAELRQERAIEDARIVGAAAARDRGGAEVIHDVTSNFDSWYFED